jgi:hypothetical protein
MHPPALGTQRLLDRIPAVQHIHLY